MANTNSNSNSNSAATLLPSTRSSRNAPPPNRRVSFDADPPAPARLEQIIPLLDDTYDDNDDTAERQVDMDAARTPMSTFRAIWASIHDLLLKMVGSVLLGAAVGIAISIFMAVTCNRMLYVQLDRWFPVIPRWLYTIARGAIGGTLAGLIIWWFDVAKALKRSTNPIKGSSGSALLESLLYPCSVVEGSFISSQHVVLTLPISMAMMASSIIALVVIGAAPLGPEFGVLIVARCLAMVATQIEAVVVQSSGLSSSSSRSRNSEDCTPPCQEQVWFDIALAATVGGIGVPIPVAILLGPLLVQEVSQRSTRNGDGQVFQATRLVMDQSMNSRLPHQTIAVLAAWICSQWILNALLEDGMGVWTLPRPTVISDTTTPDVQPRDWILAAAIGCFCGFIGCIVHTLKSLIERGCHCILSIFVIERTPADTASVVAAATTIGPLACAGLLLALIAVTVPIAKHGVFPFWSAESWSLGQQDTVFLASSVDVEGMDYLTRTQWLLIACVRSAEIAMALGFGLLGGSILPMASVGLCIGNVLGGATLWLPINIVLPSSVAAMSVTMSRAPLTTVLVLLWMGRCPLQVAGPVMISTVVASTLTNALVPQLGSGTEHAESSHDANNDELERQPSNPDDELLHNVRTAIFGGT